MAKSNSAKTIFYVLGIILLIMIIIGFIPLGTTEKEQVFVDERPGWAFPRPPPIRYPNSPVFGPPTPSIVVVPGHGGGGHGGGGHGGGGHGGGGHGGGGHGGGGHGGGGHGGGGHGGGNGGGNGGGGHGGNGGNGGGNGGGGQVPIIPPIIDPPIKIPVIPPPVDPPIKVPLIPHPVDPLIKVPQLPAKESFNLLYGAYPSNSTFVSCKKNVQ